MSTSENLGNNSYEFLSKLLSDDLRKHPELSDVHSEFKNIFMKLSEDIFDALKHIRNKEEENSINILHNLISELTILSTCPMIDAQLIHGTDNTVIDADTNGILFLPLPLTELPADTIKNCQIIIIH